MIVGRGEITRDKIGHGIGFHKACFDRLIYLFLKFFGRADANRLFPVFTHPDRQGCAPVPGTRQVPIYKIFEPVPKSTDPGSGRFPVDSFV